MTEGQDFIYVKKTNVVGGVHNSSEMIKGALFITKRFIFLIPRNVLEFNGNQNKNLNAENLIKSILDDAPEKHVEAFEAEMFAELPTEYVYPVPELDVFKVWVGFGPFGNLYIKKKGDIKKAFNVHPMSKRKKIKAFFEGKY